MRSKAPHTSNIVDLLVCAKQAMTEASLHIGVFTDNQTVVDNALTLWRGQAPAYLFVKSDGATPKRPPLQPHLSGTAPVYATVDAQYSDISPTVPFKLGNFVSQVSSSA